MPIKIRINQFDFTEMKHVLFIFSMAGEVGEEETKIRPALQGRAGVKKPCFHRGKKAEKPLTSHGSMV